MTYSAGDTAWWLRAGERLTYTFDKPRPDGSQQLTLTPLELLDRVVRFIPAPRRHLHRYNGVFVPHSALRARAVARAGQAVVAPPAALDDLADLIRRGLCLLPHAGHPLPELSPLRRSKPVHWRG